MKKSPFSMLPLFHLLFLSLFLCIKAMNYLDRGDSLSVEDPFHVLTSPSGTFTCGFYEISPTAFTFSIWFTNSANHTVVWTANRYQPVYRLQSKIKFGKYGNLVLNGYDGEIVWTTNTSSPDVYRAEILDSGNLVIKNRGNKILWQSFFESTANLKPASSPKTEPDPMTKHINSTSNKQTRNQQKTQIQIQQKKDSKPAGIEKPEHKKPTALTQKTKELFLLEKNLSDSSVWSTAAILLMANC